MTRCFIFADLHNDFLTPNKLDDDSFFSGFEILFLWLSDPSNLCKSLQMQETNVHRQSYILVYKLLDFLQSWGNPMFFKNAKFHWHRKRKLTFSSQQKENIWSSKYQILAAFRKQRWIAGYVWMYPLRQSLLTSQSSWK